MSARAKAMETLYRMGRVSKDGLKAAVNRGVINAVEYQSITGENLEG